MAIIECIPNISEGRRPDVVERDRRGGRRSAPGVRLLDVSSDAGAQPIRRSRWPATPRRCSRRVLALVRARAWPTIDLRTHQGDHPRLGAVDVVPFVPIEGVTMAECVALARDVGARGRGAVRRAGLSLRRGRRATRRGGTWRTSAAASSKGSRRRWHAPDGRPTSGRPRRIRPPARRSSARACRSSPSTSTSRPIALDVAKKIAAAVRQSSGGLRFVKAMGMQLDDRGIVQVSMNLTNYEKTPIFRRRSKLVKREAARYGVTRARERDRGPGAAGGAGRGGRVLPAARRLHARSVLENSWNVRSGYAVAQMPSSFRSSARLRTGAMPNARILR